MSRLYILVTGGRNYQNRDHVFAELDARAPLLVFHGAATGADRLAGEWCEERGVPCISMRAPWRKLRNAAGPTRNRWILEIALSLTQARSATLQALAFPGGAGTADMVRRCEETGVPVARVTP